MKNETDRRIERYTKIIASMDGNEALKVRALADKMRRGLKGDFDTAVVKIRNRIETLLNDEKADKAVLQIIFDAIELAINDKRKNVHTNRRTTIHSVASAEFENKKTELNNALEHCATILASVISTDDEYISISNLSDMLKAFEKRIKGNDEFSKKAKDDMLAGYRDYFPAICRPPSISRQNP